MHGLLLNSRAGTIWKERVAGGEDLMLDMLPRRLHGIAEQLLGKGKVLPADGSSVGQMLGVPDDDNFVRVLEERGKNDIGADSMCARWLHKLATEDWPVKKPPEANLHDMFVVGTRSRGIYATLPSPPDADRHTPGPGRGGHNDSHPFQLGVEAYIDDVPPNGGESPNAQCWEAMRWLMPCSVYTLTTCRSGGFMIWPRAHAKLFPLYKRQHSREQVDVEKPDGAWGLGSPSTMMQKCAQEIQPVDCYGPAGTCIFWYVLYF